MNELRQTVTALPKIDLHRHLEGSVRLETLIDIAQQYGIQMPDYNVEQLRPFVQMTPEQPHDMPTFMAKFITLRQFYRSPQVIRRVVHEAVEDAARDNIRYLELRFTPQALTNIIGCGHSEVVGWVCETAHYAAKENDIDVGLIVSMNRHEGTTIGEKILQAALDHRSDGVVALDLAGRESPEYPAAPFRYIFHRAKEAGLGVTVHAGEWLGSESMYDALLSLRADRIGHGVRSLEDPRLMEALVKRQITLEVCPTSNWHSGVVSSLKAHPLPELYRQQIRTTLNTDDPLVSNITLSDEIMVTLESMQMTLDDVKQQMLTAASAAFLPPAARAALVEKFQRWYENGSKPQ
ncbi:MAG: adenosine deaminase [Chloroflexi bacterium]|nr:adenosine deaminase [Chloroflexota bacterium]